MTSARDLDGPSSAAPAAAGTKPGIARSALVMLLGVVATVGLVKTTVEDESGRKADVTVTNDGVITIEHKSGPQYLKAYRDIVGVWTICDGITEGVTPGMVETPEGCAKRVEKALLDHAQKMMKCTPRLAEPGRDYQRWAAGRVTYNVGPGAYCSSSIDRAFDAGNWKAGCEAIMLYQWGTFDRAGAQRQMARGEDCKPKASKPGKFSCTIRGLRLARSRDQQICFTGMPGYPPETLEKRLEPFR